MTTLLIITLVLLCIPPVTAGAETEEKYSNGYTYTVTDGKATITHYSTYGGDIRIPATLGGYPVVEIGEAAFATFEIISSVTIPEGVVTIGDDAFMSCKELKRVTIPGTVKTIGKGAFYNCESLTAVYLAEGVTTIEERAFFQCKKLASIVLPASVTEIQSSAFNGCTQLKEISIPDGIESVSFAFGDCTSLQYNVYDNAKYLGNPQNPYALLADAVTDEITTCKIHESTKTFAASAFSDSKLKTVVIPEGITRLPKELFQECEDLTEVTIPVSVTVVDKGAFLGCRSLKTVHYAGSRAQWDQIVIERFNTDLTSADLELSFGGNEEEDDPFGNFNDLPKPAGSSDSAEGTNKSSQSGSSNQPSTKKKNTVNLWMISTIVLAVIILGVGVLLILKKKKK